VGVIFFAGGVGVCRPCSVAVFAPRLGAAAPARRLVGAVVGRHALVGAGRDIGWVSGAGGLRVGALAVEGWWGWVGVAGSLVASRVGRVFGGVVRGVGRAGCDGRRRDVGVYRRRRRIPRPRCVSGC
jgi:hypothetical protein